MSEMNDFRRPSHPDFMDSSELKKLEFSGIRINKLINQVEVWTLGEVRVAMNYEEAVRNPEKFNKLYAEVFAADKVKQVN